MARPTRSAMLNRAESSPTQGTRLGARLLWLLAFAPGLVACAQGTTAEPTEFERPRPSPNPGDAVAARCGNGVVEGEEFCDQGDLGGRTCQTEGFASGKLQCTPECRLDLTFCGGCGNGVTDPGEECDGHDFGSLATCADLSAGATDEPLLCTDGCIFDLSNCGGCGDGTINPPEDCEPATDTGKADLGEVTCEQLGWHGGNLGCDQGCRFDQSGCYACGDASKNGIEQCDGADFGAMECGDFSSITGESFTSGSLGCTSDCTIDTSNCMRCGDGVATGNEVCDVGALGGETCQTQGFSNGLLECAGDCRGYSTLACTLCGNGDVENNEQCDGANLNGATCSSLGFGGGALSCSTNCSFNTLGCANNACGDGVVNGGDACDCGGEGASCTSAQLDGRQCADFLGPAGTPYSGGALRCMSPNYCVFDLSECRYCGDGVISDGEQCDGNALDGNTCVSLGYSSGNLSCSSDCRLNESDCVLVDNPLVRCSSPVLTLPDGDPNGVTDTIELSADGQIVDVDVMLHVSHAWVGDIQAVLTHGATTRTLVDRPGVPATTYGCQFQDIDATLDDEGMGPIEQTCHETAPSIAGALIPNESLSALDGQEMSGAWTLRVADLEAQLDGTLVEWCLVIEWQ
jgi:Proprotein convertase P-domain